jgi:DNA-binding transcriptional regulator YiaG
MLKNLATRNAPLNADIKLGRLETSDVELSFSQKRMIDQLRRSGGVVAPAALENGDRRVLSALEKKGLVHRRGAGEDITYVLTDVTAATSEPEQDPLSMSTAEFRELLEDIFAYGCQTKFAKLIGVGKATVGKWSQGVLPVPRHAAVLLRTLDDMRDKGLPLPAFVTDVIME